MKLDVLYCDNHLLATAKPSGLPTVPDDSRDESLFDLAREWIRVEYRKPGEAFLGVVHRLDRPVSGVVVFARTSKAAARLTRQFGERETSKTYWGIVQGSLQDAGGTVHQWLAKDERKNRVHAYSRAADGAREAWTDWRRVAARSGTTLLELAPRTGRSHQLRVATQSLGAPLLGDLKYGAREPLEDRSIALHARRLELDHPTRSERIVFRCDPPDRAWWRAFAAEFED